MKSAPMTPQFAPPPISTPPQSLPPGISQTEVDLIGRDNPDALAKLAAERSRDQGNAPASAEQVAAAGAPPPPAPEPAPKREMLYVLDLSAQDENGRTHELFIDGLIKQFHFKRAVPTALPPFVAVKFLKYPDSFKLTDEHGDLIPFQNTPKQPHELQAGERFRLARDATVANYGELHTSALQLRVLQLDGGERFKDSRDREGMIEFIIRSIEAKEKKNLGREASLGIEEFTPPPENDSALDNGTW